MTEKKHAFGRTEQDGKTVLASRVPKAFQSQLGEEYTEEEMEFIFAVHAWIRRTGRKFPTCPDILTVAKALGYRKGSTS